MQAAEGCGLLLISRDGSVGIVTELRDELCHYGGSITDWTGIYTRKECHKTESRWNHTTTDHKEGEQLEDRRNVGENSSNSGDGTDQTGPILDVYDDDDDWASIPGTDFYLPQSFCFSGYREVFPTDRATGVWGWPQEWLQVQLHSSNMPSWLV